MPEINFPTYVVQSQTCFIEDEDMRILEKIQKEAFLFYATYHDFSYCASEFEKEFKKICEKYGVDPLRSQERIAFAKALLGVE